MGGYDSVQKCMHTGVPECGLLCPWHPKSSLLSFVKQDTCTAERPERPAISLGGGGGGCNGLRAKHQPQRGACKKELKFKVHRAGSFGAGRWDSGASLPVFCTASTASLVFVLSILPGCSAGHEAA